LRHWPPWPFWQAFGVVAVSLGPARQHGPSSVGGIGIMLQVEPFGLVPSFTNVVCAAVSANVEPFGNRIACLSSTKSSGCA